MIIDRFGVPLKAERSSSNSRFRPTARYLRDSRSGLIASRSVPLSDSRDDIRRSWMRTAALALDMIHNSGQLKGACDQIIADTIGSELLLNPQPDLSGLGYDSKERSDWINLVKDEWKRYAWNARECDFRGKFTMAQQVDITIRWFLAYGEITGLVDYLPSFHRRKYGIETGTKLCLIPPTRLVQETNEIEGLFQGVYHDENGRPVAYRFEERAAGFTNRVNHPAYDENGRQLVLHVFDPMDATDVRGISPLAPGIRTYLYRETLIDSTLQMNILQNLLAIVLTSEKPSMEAFEAIEQLKSTNAKDATEFAEAFSGFMLGALEKSAESEIQFGLDPQVSHLGPGERLDIKTAGLPGPQFLPFYGALTRDMARALGTTYGGMTMDYTDATYASTRMETSSVWPVVTRRRERIASPAPQAVYESWLDERIGVGRIPFKGGYSVFAANRDRVAWSQWQGPAKPTADDQKSAKASTERLDNRTTCLAIEAADLGYDYSEIRQQQYEEHMWYVERGMRSPYDRAPGTSSDLIASDPKQQDPKQ